MGIFQDISKALFGGDSKQSSVSKQTQTQNQQQANLSNQSATGSTSSFGKQVGQTSQTGSSTAVSSQQQTGTSVTGSNVQQSGRTVVSSLDAGTIDLLKGVLGGVAAGGLGSGDADQIRSIVQQISQVNAGGNVDQEIAARQGAARVNYAQNEGANLSVLDQTIGSRGNTFSAILHDQGSQDLEAKLAAIDADARAQARTAQVQGLSSSISGIAAASNVAQQPLNSLLEIIKTLSGAQSVQETSSGQTGTSTQQTTSGQTGTSSQSSQQDTSNIETAFQQQQTQQDVISATLAQAIANSTMNGTTSGQAYQNNGWLNNIVALTK